MGPLPPLLLGGDACAAHAARLLHQHLEQLRCVLVEQAPPSPLHIYSAVPETLSARHSCVAHLQVLLPRTLEGYRVMDMPTEGRVGCSLNIQWRSSVT